MLRVSQPSRADAGHTRRRQGTTSVSVIDVGQVLDKYELLERVGQGGMAIVYRGLDRSLQREVAVKVLHKHLAEHQEARDRFEREAHAVAKLRHENILEIFDYSGKASDESYIVTEFIDGQTLKQFVTEHPPQFPEIGAMIVTQICRALAHAHAQGILHRDVKPENVMIRADGVVKLMDFGISQMIDTQRLTVTGQLLGSPAYMSPEHVEGKPLDFRTDVFAAGIVLYQLTVGKLPFEGKNPHEILKRIAECRFPDPRHISPRIGNELGKIILRAMAREPSARYRDMGEMLAALERYLDGSGLGGVKDELSRFFRAPAPYEMALEARLVDHLLRRARDCLAAGNQAVALELLDRILAIDADNPQVAEILGKLGKRRRTRTWALVGLAAVAAGGGAWALRETLSGGAAPAAIAGETPDAAPDGAVPPDAERVVLAPADAAPPDATPAPAPDAAPRDEIVRPIRRVDAAVPEVAPIDAAPGGGEVIVDVSPETSEIRVDGGAWKVHPRGRVKVQVPPGGVRVAVRNDECCEATERDLTLEDSGKTVSINLGILPAQIIPRCKQAGVTVTIDGKPARLDRPTVITFGAIGHQTVDVVFSSAERGTDEQQVAVKYKDTREVTCKLD